MSRSGTVWPVKCILDKVGTYAEFTTEPNGNLRKETVMPHSVIVYHSPG